jgi:hypothetical protein
MARTNITFVTRCKSTEKTHAAPFQEDKCAQSIFGVLVGILVTIFTGLRWSGDSREWRWLSATVHQAPLDSHNHRGEGPQPTDFDEGHSPWGGDDLHIATTDLWTRNTPSHNHIGALIKYSPDSQRTRWWVVAQTTSRVRQRCFSKGGCVSKYAVSPFTVVVVSGALVWVAVSLVIGEMRHYSSICRGDAQSVALAWFIPLVYVCGIVAGWVAIQCEMKCLAKDWEHHSRHIVGLRWQLASPVSALDDDSDLDLL